MTSVSDPMPEWLLERIAVDEVPAAERDAVAERLTTDPALAAAVERLRRDDEEILGDYPAAEVAAEIERRHRSLARATVRPAPRPSWRHRVFGPAAIAAVAAAAVMLVILQTRLSPVDEPIDRPIDRPIDGADAAGSNTPPGTDTDIDIDIGIGADDPVRAKGDPTTAPELVVHRQVGKDHERLASSSGTRAGDRLQLSYIAAGRKHGVVVSIDGNSAVTLHFPDAPGAPTELHQGGAVPLAHSYQLDDAPDFERFFFITSDQPLDVDVVLASAERLARQPRGARLDRLELPDLIEQSSFLLRKESNP